MSSIISGLVLRMAIAALRSMNFPLSDKSWPPTATIALSTSIGMSAMLTDNVDGSAGKAGPVIASDAAVSWAGGKADEGGSDDALDVDGNADGDTDGTAEDV